MVRQILERQTIMRTRVNTHKGMTLPLIQNLKALDLWIFFLICCPTFSILLNVGLRLTFRYPILTSIYTSVE